MPQQRANTAVPAWVTFDNVAVSDLIVNRERNALFLRLRCPKRLGRIKQVTNREIQFFKLYTTGLYLREVENIIEKVQERFPRFHDCVEFRTLLRR